VASAHMHFQTICPGIHPLAAFYWAMVFAPRSTRACTSSGLQVSSEIAQGMCTRQACATAMGTLDAARCVECWFCSGRMKRISANLRQRWMHTTHFPQHRKGGSITYAYVSSNP